jgi:acetyl esterase
MSQLDGMPGEIAERVRHAGAVLDMALTQSLHGPLLERQRRDGVSVEADLAYGNHARHVLDIYRPQVGDATNRPMLLFLHGGGFIRGDKSEKENIGLYFARQGYIVALANYRLAPRSVFPAGAEDVSAALQWLRANAARFGGDARRIFIAGESAGETCRHCDRSDR